MDTEPWPAALYLRQSKGYTAIKRQRDRTTEYIEARGGRVVVEFKDEDATAFQRPGEEPPDREGFENLLAYTAAHPGVRPAAWHIDRFLRSTTDATRMIKVCHHGDHLIETKQSGLYDLSNANGRKHLMGDAMAAGHEVDHAIERILERKAEAAGDGEWCGGPRPFGWDPIPSAPGDERKFAGLRLNITETVALCDAAPQALSGVTLKAIERQWADEGITGTLGGYLDSRKIRRLLLRPRNAGICVHLGVEVGEGNWPPILRMPTFRALEARLGDPSRLTTPGPGRRHLGTGLWQCGVCHEPLRSHRGGNGRKGPGGMSRRTIYACWGHVARSARPLDAWIGDLIAARLATAGPAQIPTPAGAIDAGVVHGQILAQRQRMDQAAELFASGAIDAAQLAAISAAAREETATLRAQLVQAAHTSTTDGMPASAEEIRAWWDSLHVSRQRAIAAEQFVYVRVMPSGPGRPPGSKRGEPYFDRSAIVYEWR